MFEKKFKYIFVRKEYSTLQIVGIVKTNNINNDIGYRNRVFHISLEKPSFCEPKTKVYIIDYDNGSQLKFQEIESQLNPKELDMFMSGEIVKQLTAGAISDKKEKIVNMILGGIIGALLSAVLMFLYMQNQIAQIYESFPIITNTIP